MSRMRFIFGVAASIVVACLAWSVDAEPLVVDHPEVSAHLQTKGLHPSMALGPESIYFKESDVFRNVIFPENAGRNANALFRRSINDLFAQYRPKLHPLWDAIKALPRNVVTNSGWLAEFYKRYQAAMHVTRVMVFHTPSLAMPSQRRRMLAVLNDDDSQNLNRSHHIDLFRLFAHTFKAGEAALLPESFFHEPMEMLPFLDPETANFYRGVMVLYPSSTGAWTMAELLSDEWLSTLADSFSHFFEKVATADYFDEIFTGHVEIRHMMETVSLTEEVIARHPERLERTLNDARQMCQLLNGLWDNLLGLVRNPKPFLV